MDERMITYRKNRERFVSLELAVVVRSEPAELQVKLMAADASLHEFVFEIEKQAPYKLVSVSELQTGSMHGIHGFFHH